MHERPIVILGNRRSGTTMLRLMLTSHPRICIPPENAFMTQLGWIFGARRRLRASDLRDFARLFSRLESSQDWDLSLEALQDRLLAVQPRNYRDAVEVVYRSYMERHQPDKQRWGDKSAGSWAYVRQIASFFPEAQFVHIVRDVRGVAASYKEVPHLTNDVADAAAEWVASMRRFERFGTGQGPCKYREVRYESLLAEPEDNLRSLCAWLGEDYSAQMLEFGTLNRAKTLEPRRHLGWKQLTLESVNTARAERWRDALDADEISTIEAIAGSTLRKWGYAPTGTPVPVHRQAALRVRANIRRASTAVRQQLRPWTWRARYTLRGSPT